MICFAWNITLQLCKKNINNGPKQSSARCKCKTTKLEDINLKILVNYSTVQNQIQPAIYVLFCFFFPKNFISSVTFPTSSTKITSRTRFINNLCFLSSWKNISETEKHDLLPTETNYLSTMKKLGWTLQRVLPAFFFFFFLQFYLMFF